MQLFLDPPSGLGHRMTRPATTQTLTGVLVQSSQCSTCGALRIEWPSGAVSQDARLKEPCLPTEGDAA